MEDLERPVARQRCVMSLFLALPPLFWGVAAYTAPRKDPEVTALMHELGTLTLTTTDQYYIFMWVGITVLALRPATQLVKNNPFPRWWGYLSVWITIMFEAGAVAFVPRSGPFAWNGLLVFWSPLTLFGVWISIQSWLVFRALRAQVADPDPDADAGGDGVSGALSRECRERWLTPCAGRQWDCESQALNTANGRPDIEPAEQEGPKSTPAP